MKRTGAKLEAWFDKGDADSLCKWMDSRKAHRKARWTRKLNRMLDRYERTESMNTDEKNTQVVHCNECRYGDPCRNVRGEKAIECHADDDLEPICHPPTWSCEDGEKRG